LAAGYQRLKVKIKPGREFEPLSLLRHAVGDDVRIMADANSAYRLTDIPILKKLDTLNLMMLEQPLAEDDYVDHAELAREVQTPICLDESIRSAEDARRAIALGSAEIINIKVGRVGGLAEAKRIHNVAMENQVPVWCGGMLEIGIGRAHNLHLTTLPNFVLPGDTSASDRYFHEDIIANPFVLNSDGTLTIPTGPGIGVFPDPDKLKRFGTYHEAWDIPKWHLRGGKPNAATLGF
jgi:O-succinylbenzoate synthase